MRLKSTWIDWWVFIPLSLVLAIGSYWFVPAILKPLGIPEKDMVYTGTAWVYDLFKSGLVFMFGIGVVSLAYRFFFKTEHQYSESGQSDVDFLLHPQKQVISLLIPAFMLLCFCLCVIAVF